MASIDEIILRSTNPFDNIRSVNFWHEQQQPEPEVESIHQEAIATIEATLDQVAKDHRTRTLILDGDPGSGKTYVLGRLKKEFNHKAFFAYIPPVPQIDHIWRHTLRYTVDSLVQVPEGQTDSQLLLWLNSVLSPLKQRTIKDKILKDDVLDLLRSDRQKFINQLKSIYKKVSIYNADSFFGVLHDLTNPEIYPLACEWLRGDGLSKESLETLKVNKSIDDEIAAQEIIANFSRIAGDTQPIVLCFDQINMLVRIPDAVQTLFDVNTKIHDEDNNFLIIISINIDIWSVYKNRIDQSDKARIDREVALGLINLEQAESLLASRLYLLHYQANPNPKSSLYPLTRQYLEDEFPGGKTNPRNSIILGRDIFLEYKKWLFAGNKLPFKPLHSTQYKPDSDLDLLAAFKLKWHEEFTKVQQRIAKVRYLSSPELIQMLQEALAALQVEGIQTPLFTGTKFASYSLGYQLTSKSKSEQFGVVWTEDSNMNTFFHVMEACGKEAKKNPALTLLLIRAEEMGSSKNKGYKKYTEIFTGSRHHRITPNLTSVHYLATYHGLVKDAREGDLVIGGMTLSFKNLQSLIRECKVLNDCPLLQDLGIVTKSDKTGNSGNQKDTNGTKKSDGSSTNKGGLSQKELMEAKDFLLNVIKTQHLMGKAILMQNTLSQFSRLSETHIEDLIKQLCKEKKIQLFNPTAQPEAQLICLIPKK